MTRLNLPSLLTQRFRADKKAEGRQASEVRYSLKDPVQFAEFLRNADVKLIRWKYLFDLVVSKRPLPRRQEAESQTFTLDGKTEKALVSHKEVDSWAKGEMDAIICSISHAWETCQHPDPCMFQLKQIVGHGGLFQAAFEADLWIFYDYVSLFQFERERGHQQNSFGKAMENMHIMYSHECTLTFRIEGLTPENIWKETEQNNNKIPVFDLQSKSVVAKPLKKLKANRTDYLVRGWCKAEIEWSSLRTVNAQNQCINSVPQENSVSHETHTPSWLCLLSSMCLTKLWASPGADVQSNGADSEDDDAGSEDDDVTCRIPMTPAKFKDQMKNAKFTHRCDAPSVIRLQENIFFEKVTMCEHLVLESLSARHFVSLAEALPSYQNLKKLKVTEYKCGEAEAKAFSEALATMNIETLEVSQPEMFRLFGPYCDENISGNIMAKALGEVLKTNTSVRNIDLTGCRMEKEGVQAFAEALKVNTSVQNIRFDTGGFGASAIEFYKAMVDDALERNRLAAGSKFGDQDGGDDQPSGRMPFDMPVRIEALAEALKVNKIREIRLSHENIGHTGCQALARAFMFNCMIREVHLSSNDIRNEDCKALAEALKVNESICKVHLDRNHIGDTDCQALAEAFEVNKSICYVELSHNLITDTGCKALAKALKVNESICDVHLDDNHIGDTGCKALAEAFEVNKSICKVRLEDNHIGDTGCKALAEAFEVNKSIEEVRLDDNHIGDTGCKALAKALTVNESICYVQLSHNLITDTGCKALAEALKMNQTIRKVNLSRNKFGEVGCQALREVTQEKKSMGIELDFGIRILE